MLSRFPALLALVASTGFAMDVRVAGDQLILSGPINGDEIARMRDVLPANKQIGTVVLKDSPGGDVWTAMRLGELFEDRKFRTAVSGRCLSACVIVFLGGVERMFAEGEAGRRSYIAIHTPTHATDGGLHFRQGEPTAQGRSKLFYWMAQRVKDVELLERGLSNTNPAGLVYLFEPARSRRRDNITVFQCHGHEKRRVADCEPIAGKDAFQAGFITSTAIVQVK